jgi:perosamine synthetase
MNYKIPQIYLDAGKDEMALLKNVIDSKWLTEGKYTNEFVDKIKIITGAKYVVPVSNGTLGLYVALLSMNLPPGSEVLIPSFTFFGSASSVYYAGLKPVFVDVSPKNYMASVENYSKKITSNTSAIMPVHIYGLSCDMKPLIKFAKDNKLKIIEDAAQSIGVKYNSKHCGTFGDTGVISFFADKTVTMGEGGVILTNNYKLYCKLKLVRNQGRPNSGTFIHPEFGMNFRVTDMQSAVGFAQLKKLEEKINKKNKLFKMYLNNLKDCKNIKIIEQPLYSNFVPFRFAFRSKKKKKIQHGLQNHGIQTRSFFYPLHKQPAIKKYFPKMRNISLPVSEMLYQEGICLPIHEKIKKKDINFICELIKRYSK